MHKIKILIFCISVATTNILIAQTVEVIRKSGFQSNSKSREFAFIEPVTDTGSLKYIATIRATGDFNNTDIDLIYFEIRDKALELGGNCFRLNNYTELESMHTASLTLDIYYGTDAALYVNFLNHEKNVVYIIGSPYKFGKSYSFRIDSAKKVLQGGTYYRHENKIGQEVMINKGLINGETVWIKWENNKPAKFLAITGFEPRVFPVLGNHETGVYLSFKSGRIHEVNGNLGHLLISLMQKSE